MGSAPDDDALLAKPECHPLVPRIHALRAGKRPVPGANASCEPAPVLFSLFGPSQTQRLQCFNCKFVCTQRQKAQRESTLSDPRCQDALT